MIGVKFQNASVSYYVHKNKSFQFKNDQNAGSDISESSSKRFIEILALRDINIDITEGMKVGLVGINGSGKSTFLKCCSHGLWPKAGKIEIEGQVTPQLSTVAGMKLVLSGKQNVEMRCIYSGIPMGEIKDYVEQVKVQSGLGDYFELPMATYSAGMRTRLVMGMLSILKGDIVVIDEWINQADASVGKIAEKLQAQVIEQAKCLIMSSHSVKVLRNWSEYLIWLHKGELMEFGNIETVWKSYSKFIKTLN